MTHRFERPSADIYCTSSHQRPTPGLEASGRALVVVVEPNVNTGPMADGTHATIALLRASLDSQLLTHIRTPPGKRVSLAKFKADQLAIIEQDYIGDKDLITEHHANIKDLFSTRDFTLTSAATDLMNGRSIDDMVDGIYTRIDASRLEDRARGLSEASVSTIAWRGLAGDLDKLDNLFWDLKNHVKDDGVAKKNLAEALYKIACDWSRPDSFEESVRGLGGMEDGVWTGVTKFYSGVQEERKAAFARVEEESMRGTDNQADGLSDLGDAREDQEGEERGGGSSEPGGSVRCWMPQTAKSWLTTAAGAGALVGLGALAWGSSRGASGTENEENYFHRGKDQILPVLLRVRTHGTDRISTAQTCHGAVRLTQGGRMKGAVAMSAAGAMALRSNEAEMETYREGWKKAKTASLTVDGLQAEADKV
ncbi:uncharacterized protein MKK02DRAFT_30838 [Dioszegia hungarica]|uniref:Uncharacterized protein n=1 Tax=Dioszegia hungarica TaxID=4972 RepID=A0AA38H0T4_9TREE|nr:uncharacterized protein MKK02DRAFT_30838 [Dioszegia hungarica]KAI9631840.1 hypothetical protein MKK02DRAFT_30838 [Dioszegia hungarica]